MKSFFGGRFYLFLMGALSSAFFLRAEEQVWDDLGPDNIWSTNAPNWAGGAVWTNGNSAVFSGAGGAQTGETVDVSATVSVASMAFQTNGYVIADADGDGSLAFAGGGEVRVVNTGDLAVVSEAVGGAGFTKTGAGVLQLAGANTFTGVVRVAAGTLRLSKWTPACLGATGTGNETIVENGATLDIYGAFTDNLSRAENILLSGSGVGGQGALVNTGFRCMNSGFSGTTTLLGDTLIGCQNRIDFRGNVVGNNYTLTKAGGAELAVGVEVNNCRIVINNGYYTYMNAKALGTNDFDTTLNGGALRSYGSYKLTERLVCNGGSIVTAGSAADTLFNIAGRVTLNSNVTAAVEGSLALELSGLLDGAGGISRTGGGYVYVTGTSNTYSGATLVSGPLYIGRTNLYEGTLGSGVVTNSNTIYCYSGKLGSGDIVNNGNLYFDRTNTFTVTNRFFGTGVTAVRYGGRMILSDSASSNSNLRLGMGSLTLTNGASFCANSGVTLAERSGVGYPVDPSNVVAELNIVDGTALSAYHITIGNGSGGSMTGTINQVGGTVRTFGWTGSPAGFPGEYDGLRLGHYPTAYGVYNMMGGVLAVDNGYRLAIATDGKGWFRQTGGEVYSSCVIVNERDDGNGYGRLTVEGGVFNVGSNGVVVGTNVAAGGYAPYLVEYGGLGGIVRASTNFASPLSATLFGSNENAITFDTTNWTVALSGRLSGTGGLNKAGSGTLVLSGGNTFSGAIRILKGRVVPGAANALPAGGQILFGVADDDTGGVLHATNDFSLSELNVGVANPQVLDTSKHYTVITCDGELSGLVAGDTLPDPWYLYYDWANDKVELRAAIGSVMLLR